MAQITLNSSGVASNGSLVLQSNGTTTAVTVDASQNVGIGTASPDGKLHVSDASTGTTLRVVNTSSSSGSRAFIRLVSATSTFGSALFQTNGTDASYTTSALNLYAFDSQPLVFGTSNTERMRITSAGDVGIGTSSPVAYKLDVRGNAGFSSYTGSDYQLAAVSPSGADRQVFLAAVSGVSNGLTVRYISGAMQYTLTGLANGTVSSSGGVLSASSDQDKKVADGEVLSAIDKVLSLKPRYFYWKDTDGNANEEAGRQLGFFAQEVNTIVPEASPEPKGKDEGWGIYDRSLVAVLTKAIQEQQAIITQLQADVAALKGTA